MNIWTCVNYCHYDIYNNDVDPCLDHALCAPFASFDTCVWIHTHKYFLQQYNTKWFLYLFSRRYACTSSVVVMSIYDFILVQ